MAAHDSDKKETTVCNKNYESDIHYILKMTKWLLMPLGLWSFVSKTSTNKEILISIIAIVASTITILWVLLPCTRHLIYIEKDYNVQLTKMAALTYSYRSVLLYIVMILCSSRIKDCFKHISEDWRNLKTDEDRNIMIKDINIGRKITLLCGLFAYTGGFSYHAIMPLVSGNDVNEMNETIRPHVYPGYDDFVDAQKTPAYEIIFVAHVVTITVECTITTASCNLTAIIVAHAVGQIEIVMTRVKKIVDENDKYNVKPEKRIAIVIEGHVNVLRLTVKIEKVLRYVCLVVIVGSTIIMCLVEYCAIKGWKNSESVVLFTYIMIIFSLSFDVFLFCYISELLTQRLSDVGELAYMINWYRLPGKTSLPLTLIIAIAHTPKRLSAGGLLELSVTTFGQIMKTSVVYLNMLYTMES